MKEISYWVHKEFGRKPYKYIINTHSDVDHNRGNGFFNGAAFIGPKELIQGLHSTQKRIVSWQVRYRGRLGSWLQKLKFELDSLPYSSRRAKVIINDIDIVQQIDSNFAAGFNLLPNDYEMIAYRQDTTLHLGNITLKLFKNECGHTRERDDDQFIYIPEEKILFTGDALQFRFWKDKDIKIWLSLMKKFRDERNLEYILGGHDHYPYTKEYIKHCANYYLTLWDLMKLPENKSRSLESIKKEYSFSSKHFEFMDWIISTSDEPEKLQTSLSEIHLSNIDIIVNELIRKE